MKRLAFGLLVLLGLGGTGTEKKAFAQAAEAGKPGEAGAAGDSKAEDIPDLPPAETPTGTVAQKKWEDIVVVPRKAFLKGGRVELAPFTGVSLNDVLIRHYSFGGDLNYYLTDVFSIGLQGQYFIKERTDRESVVGLQYNRVSTLNRYKYAGALNFGYVPGYGKFTLFNRYILNWDISVSAGVGVIWTEIIPRIVGDQTFQSQNIAPDFGVGTRFFLNDWLTFSVTFRDYVFNDKFEPLSRMPGDAIGDVKAAASSQIVNNMMLYASVGFFLPTSFQYRTPR
jgi:outer membrane beta-barrel protein